MFSIILVVLLLICAGLAALVAEGRMKALAIIPVVLAGLVFINGSFYRIQQRESGVVVGLSGKVKGSPVTTPGFHAKSMTDKVVKFETGFVTVNFNLANEKKDDTDTVIYENPISASTGDVNAPVNFDYDLTVTYRQIGKSVGDIYSNYKSQPSYRDQVVLPGMRSAGRVNPTKYIASEIQNKRPQLEAGILTDLNTKFAGSDIEITSVNVRDIRLPRTVTDRFSEAQARLAQVQSARADLERAQVEAETTKVQAKASSDADQIARCGAATTTEHQLINGQDTVVTVTTPVPPDKCQNRINEQVLLKQYIDVLGKFAGQPGSTIYLLPPGSDKLLTLPGTPSTGVAAK